ncbi:hypothetical protein RRG08_055310 [Elysia crispata]|uniref:Uncharacterized protein n=1 Tax=Elysia crispata TaxID=231223 RepID=A0AAE1E405_9GAST|nr:hypothetical protein RRG08_055310 [Elysia crispata]
MFVASNRRNRCYRVTCSWQRTFRQSVKASGPPESFGLELRTAPFRDQTRPTISAECQGNRSTTELDIETGLAVLSSAGEMVLLPSCDNLK